MTFIRLSRLGNIKCEGIRGIATNDSEYITNPSINGKRLTCPYYRKWTAILERCYDIKLHKRYPTYKDCTVSEDWHLFTNFLKWAEGEYSDYFEHEMGEKPTEAELHSAAYLGDLCLDKDILVPNNKIYSKDTCCFVSQEVNSLLLICEPRRGKYAIGVSFNKSKGKFQSRLSIAGTIKHLGWFDSEAQAHNI